MAAVHPYAVATIDSVRAAAVPGHEHPAADGLRSRSRTDRTPGERSRRRRLPATELILKPTLDSTFASQRRSADAACSFVDGGQPTNVGKTEVSAAELADPEGVPLDGIVDPPPGAVAAAAAAGTAHRRAM